MAESKIDVVTVPELTPEEERALRAKFEREDQLKAQASEEHAYTNPTDQQVFIPDLGIRTGDRFHAESIGPRKTKDLSKIHRPRDIKASKYLPLLCEPGPNGEPPKLVKGRVQVADRPQDAFRERAKAYIDQDDFAFEDPVKDRYYDKKLRAMEDKEDKEQGPGKRITVPTVAR